MGMARAAGLSTNTYGLRGVFYAGRHRQDKSARGIVVFRHDCLSSVLTIYLVRASHKAVEVLLGSRISTLAHRNEVGLAEKFHEGVLPLSNVVTDQQFAQSRHIDPAGVQILLAERKIYFSICLTAIVDRT